ncbi:MULTISPECIES: hypothetical protein [Nocardiopsis]|uniref:Uncharacterized protein n=1 Tax=Nocardiopsis sinuspersici TaxID=501010 RepID=A0A1V3BW20_9ACTN|nr:MULTISPECIES: hypothetical protein [Nocardiopsis]OOC52449.1 hypothetical protein NOSIN_00200 [Nocardiopsis sinuspersici]
MTLQTAQGGGRMAVHVYTQQDGTYDLRIVISRQDREATIAALKDAGVERSLDGLQEGPVTSIATLVASVASALGLRSVLVALIKINQGKKVTFTSENSEVVLDGYSAKDVSRILKDLGLGAAPALESDDTVGPS